MALGGAALALRQRGYPWHRIGPALGGLNSRTTRILAAQYVIRSTLQDFAAEFASRNAPPHVPDSDCPRSPPPPV